MVHTFEEPSHTDRDFSDSVGMNGSDPQGILDNSDQKVLCLGLFALWPSSHSFGTDRSEVLFRLVFIPEFQSFMETGQLKLSAEFSGQ